MLKIYVDADACPVRDEVVKVAQRHELRTYMVSDGGIRPFPEKLIELVVVAPGEDAADDWIVEKIGSGDILVTSDILLADRCIKNGAVALKPSGDVLEEKNIGSAVASRHLMAGLREAGETLGGPKPFTKKDRSRFSNSLESLVCRAR